MTYDSFVAAAVAAEARGSVLTAWVEGVHQPEERLVTLAFYGRSGKWRWAFSADARRGGVWRTERRRPNPPTAPGFCMLVRKYLEGARLVAVETQGFDRILRWRFERSDAAVSLVAEVMGKHSNVILVDAEERILGALKNVPAHVSRARQVLPGLPYAPPPVGTRLDPRFLPSEAFRARFDAQPVTAETIVAHLSGFGPFAARELLARAGGTEPEAVREALAALMAAVAEERFAPTLLRDGSGRPEGFWAFPVSGRGGGEPAATISAAIEAVFDAAASVEAEAALRRDLRERVRAALERAERQLRRVEEDLAGEARAEIWRVEGELLAANLYRVSRGDTQVEVVDYYDPEQRPRVIALDAERTPQENVERFFRKHRKAIDAAAAALEQESVVRERARQLAALRDRVEHAPAEELPAVREAAAALGVLPEREARISPGGRPARAREPEYPPGVRIRSRTVEGWEILHGENATSNDYLTTKVARPDDLWLHVRAAASAHVVVRTGGRPDRVPPRVLEAAARVAAAHSESKHSGLVPVDYVLRKHVRKPRKSAPGRVTYQNEKTLFIAPEPAGG
jgi:predicted ribosome quality control (RQC) complex YloA/Tae2 family protein